MGHLSWASALLTAAALGADATRLSNEVVQRCPRSCTTAGLNSNDWFAYHKVNRLNKCNETMLLDFALFNDLDDPTHISISACTADLDAATGTPAEASTCDGPVVSQTNVTSSLQMGSSGSSSSDYVSSAVTALSQLQAYTTLSGATCDDVIKYGFSGDVIVGVYAGSALARQNVVSSVLEQVSSQIQSDNAVAENVVFQLCDDRSSRYGLGVFVNTNGDLGSVQHGLQLWKNSSCIDIDGSASWKDFTYSAPVTVDSNSTETNSTLAARARNNVLHARDDCTTVQVVSGDSCATLVSECGITSTEFYEYNTDSDLCSTLAVGQYVCCSSGTLPDLTPKNYDNGTCYTYTVQEGDYCSAIAASYSITADDIEDYNTDTWGWEGCSDLIVGAYICLSDGDAPMPAALSNAVCGPQVPNTTTPDSGTDLSTLNPCPLNACCDIWGQCGTTAEFCTITNSTTGAPGTAASGTNGCISNCGTDVVIGDVVSEWFKVGYMNAGDYSRDCLTMSPSQIKTDDFTHIHYSFATFDDSWAIIDPAEDSYMQEFAAISGVKKIIAFGGWDFSTDTDTYTLFRDLVSTSDNRATFISNVVAYLDKWDFDGIDLDWEYPDEPDIPGIPAGSEADSTGYLALVTELKDALGADYTLSFTAPASYWYLQYFPIADMADVVDYVVFMTYDLHGQWDYTNANADEGCADGGNCLRSHVNATETSNSLSMITKAGVDANKIVVGVSSYARSFKMTTAGCWTPECTYTGPDSGALAGICTDTAGILANYEIELILAENPTAVQYWDEDSFSSIMIYNETEWAAYINDTNKNDRLSGYVTLGFLGTADWAIDYQSPDGNGGTGDDGSFWAIDPDSGDSMVIGEEGWGIEERDGYPCTSSYANTAIVAYASTTVTGGSTVCTGDATTLQAGKSLTVQFGSDMTVAVGTMTGDAIFTSLSSVLNEGCTVPTAGVTVTTCSDIPEITGVDYMSDLTKSSDGTRWVNTDVVHTGGKLKVETLLMNVWNQTVLEILIAAIAAGVNATSLVDDNTVTVSYDCITCWESASDWPDYNLTSVSRLIQAIYTEQSPDTDGAVELQNLEVLLTLESDTGDFICGAGAFVLDTIALIAAVIPGLEWLDFVAGPADALSAACLATEVTGDDE